MKISEDRKTGTIKIAVEFKDPLEAKKLAKLIIKELQEIMVDDIVERSKRTLKEIEKALTQINDPLIKQKLQIIKSKQMENILLAKADTSSIFKVIDPPRVPERKYKPKRLLIISITFILSVFVGIFLIFFKEYIDKAQQRYKEKI